MKPAALPGARGRYLVDGVLTTPRRPSSLWDTERSLGRSGRALEEASAGPAELSRRQLGKLSPTAGPAVSRSAPSAPHTRPGAAARPSNEHDQVLLVYLT
jgi:hypothetical protein